MNRTESDPSVAADAVPFDLIFDALPAPALLQDDAFRLVAVNRAFEDLSGYGRAELVGRDSRFLHHPDHLARLQSSRERILAGERLADGLAATRLVARDGRVHHVQIRTSRLERGGRFHLLCVVENVDEVHQREQRLVSRAEWFRILFEQSPVPVAVQDESHRIARVNAAFSDWCGYTAAELVGRDPVEFHLPELRDEILARRVQRGRHGDGAEWVSYPSVAYPEFVHRDGRRLSYRLHLQSFLAPDARAYTVAVLLDMTKEVASQAAIARQASNFLRAFDRAPAGMIVADATGAIVRSNAALTELTGYSAEEIRSGRFSLGDAGAEGTGQGHDDVGSGSVRRRVRVRRRDGRMIWLEELRRSIDSLEGGPVRLSVVQDVTREHELRSKLQDMVLQQSVLLRSMGAGLAHVVGELVVQVNPVLSTMLGKPASEILGRPYESLFGTPAFWRQVRTDSADVLRAGGAYRVEARTRLDDGGLRVFDLSMRRVDRQRADLGVIVTVADISELRSQADRLQRAIAELGAVLENEAVGIAYLHEGRIRRCNRRMAELIGVDIDALPGRSWLELFTPMAPSQEAEIEPAEPRSTTMRRLQRPDGTWRDCMVYVGPVDSNVQAIEIAVVIDKTDREAAVARAAAAQARFESFTALLTEAVFLIDLDQGRGVFANEHFDDVMGASAREFRERPDVAWSRVVPARRACVDVTIARAVSSTAGRSPPDDGRAAAIDLDITHPTKGARTLRVRMFLDRGASRELYVIAEDVTEYRLLERQRLEEALQQRDLLVREVHHRIKNNLQGVAGLLQQIGVRRPEVGMVLDEVASQIHAIAQVHGLQVRRDEVLQPGRILLAVCAGLRTMFGALVDVAPDVGEGAAWGVPEQEAVPLALVINELITNAIKHRQPASSRVSVTLRASAEGMSLLVANEGALPDGFAFDRQLPAPTGLGLVKALLPRRGTRLTLQNRAPGVTADLLLYPPALRRLDPDSPTSVIDGSWPPQP